MKLNYRDRIIIGVLLALVVLLGGFFMFIKPKNEEIKDNKATLAELEKSKAEVEAKIAEIPGIKKDITASYDNGIKFTETFVDIENYDNTRKFDQYMQKLAEDNKVTITSLSVSDISTGSLGYYYFVPPVVAESFRLQFDINGELKEEIDELRKESTALSARTAETLMKSEYTITVTGEEKEDIWNYISAIEEQKETIIIDSVSLSNIEIKEDPNKEETGDKEDRLPTASFSISLYSVVEMSQPDLEMK